MKTKSVFTIMCFVLGIFSIHSNTCNAMPIAESRKAQESLMQQAQQQIKTVPEETLNIQRKILLDTRDKIEQPSVRPASPLAAVKERIDILLSKEQVSPEEIDAIRKDLEKITQGRDAGIDRAEYEALKEKLDTAYGFTKSITDLKQSQKELLEKLNNNFDVVAETGEKATYWKKVFSGGLSMSFILNVITIGGFIIKVPSAKLEKQIKELTIVEKIAKLEKDGIDLKKYSSRL
ncbi:MAG: hypothetical protein JW715_08550 [Sedimentisphaerales bacterium]|nr:hypothetical protein [Sedimentisphaerales bacterium]